MSDARHNDAELIALAKQIRALDRAIAPVVRAQPNWTETDWDAYGRYLDQWHPLWRRMVAMPAHTMAGLRTKARLARPALRTLQDGCEEKKDAIVASLARDVLRLTA